MSEKIKVVIEYVKCLWFLKILLLIVVIFFGVILNIELIVLKCVYCIERYFLVFFSKVIDINVRKDIFRCDKRCFMCLNKGYLVE